MNSNNFHEGSDITKRQSIPIIYGDAEEPQQISSVKMTASVDQTPAQAPIEEKPQTSSPATIILQWLTYAFWGWLILGLIWLLALIFTNSLTNDSSSVLDMLPYAIAGTVVIFPIALICDLIYRKKEPKKKAGASAIIMIIHAVLFALLGIGALIIAVFVLLNTLLSGNSNINEELVVALTAGSAALLYAVTFVRTLQPFKKSLSLHFGIVMTAITAALLVLAVAGPLTVSLSARDDRVTKDAISSVRLAVNSYVDENSQLPKSLDDIRLKKESARSLVSQGAIEFIPEGKVLQPQSGKYSDGTPAFRYKLCAMFKTDDSSSSYKNSTYYDDEVSNNGYESYVSWEGQTAGRFCTKLYVNAPVEAQQLPIELDIKTLKPATQ